VYTNGRPFQSTPLLKLKILRRSGDADFWFTGSTRDIKEKILLSSMIPELPIVEIEVTQFASRDIEEGQIENFYG